MKPYLRIDRPEDKPAAWRTSVANGISATKGTVRIVTDAERAAFKGREFDRIRDLQDAALAGGEWTR